MQLYFEGGGKGEWRPRAKGVQGNMLIGEMVEAWGQGRVKSSRWCSVDCRG